MKNGLSKIFDFRGHIIDTSDQAVFTLKDSGLNDEEGEKKNTSDSITASQIQSGSFVLLMLSVHPDQADTNCKHSHMTCKSCVQLPLDSNGIDASINTQILKTCHNLQVHLEDLENGRKSEIDTLQKEKGEIFSWYYTEIFKAKLLRYVNEVLFEMVKTTLNETYL